MTNSNIFISLLFVLLLLIAVQKLGNIRKESRYQQVWLPIVAVILMIFILRFEESFLAGITNFVFDQFPILEDYFLITSNLIILAVFVMTKWVWRSVLVARDFLNGAKIKFPFISSVVQKLISLIPEKWLKQLTKKDETVFIAYQRTHKGIKRKPEWSFAEKLFKFTSFLALMIVVTQFTLVSFQFFPSVLEILPKYPILSFLVLVELTWFLGGLLLANEQLKIGGTNVSSQKLAQYDALFEEYERLWPNRILASSKVQESHIVKEFMYERLAKDPSIQMKINHICARLKKEGMRINGNYAKILTNILEEEDVLIEDPVYQELGHYFFPAIYGLLSKNKKILVITHSSKVTNETVEWFQKGIHKASGLDFAWNISTFQDAVEQNIDADILVVSPNNLLQESFYQFLNKYKDTGYIEGVILLEAEKFITEYGLLLHLFNMKLHHLVKKKPQYIVLSQWYVDLEHSLHELLFSVPKDTLAALPKSEQLYYMIWKTEGEESYQNRILNKMIHRRLETEAILTLPAIKYGVESIHNVYQNEIATLESFEELLDNPVHLKKYGITDRQSQNLRKNIHFYEQNCSVPVDEFSFLLVRDHHHNLVNALMQWNSIGKKASFVHIISPPYLLRDYLASNLAHFLDNNRKLAPISARVSNITWRKAYLLLEKLSTDYMNEEDIKRLLKQIVHPDTTVLETLNHLFRQIFKVNVDFMHVLNMKNEEVFDMNQQTFVNITQYYLPAKVKKEIFPTWFRFYDIKTNTGTVLGQILEGHIFQKYIVGQYHVFNGLSFQIKNIDKHRGDVEVSYETPTGDISYRQIRDFHLGQIKNMTEKINETIPVLKNGFEVRKCLIEHEFQVVTNGYFSFSKGQELMSKSTDLTLFNEDWISENKRHYQNGNVLIIKLSTIKGQILYPDKVAFTFAFLLNEIFPTLYPQTYQYLAASTTIHEELFTDSPFLERLRLFSPQIINTYTYNTKESIYLYILEDSPLGMGLLESISERWDHILEILSDYLVWTREQIIEGYEPYFYLGNKQVPEVFDIENTMNLISCLTPDNALQGIRTKMDIQQDLIENVIDTVECDFCGDSFPIAEKESLDDRRDRCFSCRATAIDTVEELEPLYELIREFFVLDLDLTLRRDINVQLSNAKDIQAEIGKSFIPSASFDPRIIGLATRSNDNQFSILIENGAPKTQTLATLTHELTHIWQYEHLKIEDMSPEQLEGHAVWTEIHFLEKMGERDYATKLKEQMARRNDEYGRGYRQLMEVLKEHPEGTTPFELYHSRVMVYE